MYEEKARSAGSILAGFLIGGLIGAAAALLMAPQSGAKTRAMLREKGTELVDTAEQTMDQARARAEQAIEEARSRAKDVVSETRSRAERTLGKAQQRTEEMIDHGASEAMEQARKM
jgi:gas vesicle protein